MRRIDHNRWSLRFPVVCKRRFRLNTDSFFYFCWCLTRIWHLSGSIKRISQRQTRLRRGRPVAGLGNLCGAGDGLSFPTGAATAVTVRDNHGELPHTGAQLDRVLRGGESSEWHGADCPGGEMPRGLRLEPDHGLEGFVLSARHLRARRQLQGGFLCSPEQQPWAVGDEQQNENNLLRPG